LSSSTLTLLPPLIEGEGMSADPWPVNPEENLQEWS